MQRPPINEVVWSVAINRTASLIGPYLPDVLGPWFAELPEVQPVLPYQMPPEHHDLRQGFAGTQNPILELLPVPDAFRYWLSAPAQPWLLQVQNDYLALNWRAGHSDEPYVGFQEMRRRFTVLLAQVQEGLQRRGAALRPLRAEMTYINIIEPNDLWQQVGHLHRVLAIELPDSQQRERLSLAYSKAMKIEDSWVGRVHVSLDTGFDPLKEAPRVALSITARSGSLALPSTEGSLHFLDSAHTSIEETFLSLVSDSARKEWDL